MNFEISLRLASAFAQGSLLDFLSTGSYRREKCIWPGS